MRKNLFRPHPIMIFYLMRSFWFVFASPVIRIAVEYVFFKRFRLIAPFEVVLLLIVVLMSVAEWVSIKIVLQDGEIVFYKGFIIKTVKTIGLSSLYGICARQSLFGAVISCVNVTLVTESNANNKNKSDIKLKTSDYRVLRKCLFIQKAESSLKPKFMVKRLTRNAILLCMALISVGLMCFCVFETSIWQWLTLTVIFVLSYVVIYVFNHKKGFVCFGKHMRVESYGLFCCKRLCCDKKDLGVIKVTQTPADRRDNTCKIKIILGGESGESIKIKNIDYIKAKNAIINFLTP